MRMCVVNRKSKIRRVIGTVRAQTTHIYAKANVDGRSQLMSIFMEELLNVESTSI